MKHLLFILAVATIMVSCKTKTKEDTQVLSASQLADYSDYLKWKETKENAVPVVTQKAPAKVIYKTVPVQTTAAVVPAKKKGWSKAAKGTAIGAGSGAILGAIINKKNRGLGAVIGGVIGGGVGYGVGRSQDKKDGR